MHLGVRPLEGSYPFFKLRGQRVLSKNVKHDPLEAEQEGWFDHGEGLVQTIPTGHHGQVHHVLRPFSLCQRSAHDVPRFTETKDRSVNSLEEDKNGTNDEQQCFSGAKWAKAMCGESGGGLDLLTITD